MSVQARLDLDTTGFIFFSFPAFRADNAVIFQDAGRSGDIVAFTLMAQIAATGKWKTFTDETATDGTAIPAGIFVPSHILTEITEADIKAGDVEDVPILTFGAKFDQGKLVIENAKTLATIIATGTVNAMTVEEALKKITLIPMVSRTASLSENP